MCSQIKDELRFLALEVSGSFKERWEGPPQPIRVLLYQPLSSKLRPLSPPPPPASLKGTQASRNEFEIRRRVASTSVCTGARIWGRSASRTQILKTRSGTPTSSHQSAYATEACANTHADTHSWSKTQRWTETSLNPDQKSYWQISANNHVHLTD